MTFSFSPHLDVPSSSTDALFTWCLDVIHVLHFPRKTATGRRLRPPSGDLPEQHPDAQGHRGSIREQSTQEATGADSTESDAGAHHEEEGGRPCAGWWAGWKQVAE